MGTNYYRIPTEEEIEQRKEKLKAQIDTMPTTPADVETALRYIDNPEDEWSPFNPWDEFIEGTNIHLGKRSMGWRFCWNFHNNRYYQDRASLLAFIRTGRVVDEYGESWDTERFIAMAAEWCQPDGLVADAEYFNTTNHHSWMSNPEDYYDREVDGLRVAASTEFS
jgi:hypothetical protein